MLLENFILQRVVISICLLKLMACSYFWTLGFRDPRKPLSLHDYYFFIYTRMEEEFRQWRLREIESRASAYTSGSNLDQSGLTYEDFRSSIMQGNDSGQLLNYVNSSVIFQAGVDFESKPMVVFCACNLPSPKDVDYDRLLNLIIFRLDEFVENDYTVVMLTSGAQHTPGWQWMTKAYRRLDRKYRKNVKNVYVVHPSMWSKLLFQIVGKLVR